MKIYEQHENYYVLSGCVMKCSSSWTGENGWKWCSCTCVAENIWYRNRSLIN